MPDRAQQHRLGRGEVLAEALVGVEEERVDDVLPGRRDGGVQPVLLVRTQILLDAGHHLGAVVRPGGQGLAELATRAGTDAGSLVHTGFDTSPSARATATPVGSAARRSRRT